MAEVRGVPAATTGPDTLLVIGDSQETTVLTGITQKGVGAFHQTFLSELGHAVTNDAITFHLTESQATFTSTAFSRLPGQHHQRS